MHAPPNQELLDYLRLKPAINPLRRTLTDSSVLYGLLMGVSTLAMAQSGYADSLTNIINADINWFRLSQGALATANVTLTTFLAAVGRFQTYSDLADAQKGMDPVTIISRAQPRESTLSRGFNWCLKNTFNINAGISLPLCGLMMASGIASNRPGEALTGALLLPVYMWQLKKEKYGQPAQEDKPKNFLSRVFDVAVGKKLPSVLGKALKIGSNSSMLLPALVTSWRNVPMAANAVIKGDFFQAASFCFSLAGLAYKANTTKDGIGRAGGSIVSVETENGTAIARSMLEGRLRFEMSSTR